ncbi:DUF4321 domain-containing protein [candidate division KSB1 bacterium]|nr:DUF4321 domain-containing protein [candidate division KSB1 bacterium]
MKKKTMKYVIFILFLGLIIGSALGKIIAWILPDGSVVEKFFVQAATWGVEPITINAGLMTLTFGFTFELNVVGILGVAIAAYLLKYYL